MVQVFAIAINTFKETVRDRVLYAFIFFAIVLTMAGILLGTLSVGQSMRVLEDIGLFTISTIGGIIAIFVGTNLVYKELDKRTIYLIFTKPIRRWQFIVGKFLGLALCILIMTGLMGGFLIVMSFFTSDIVGSTSGTTPWSNVQQTDAFKVIPGMVAAIGTIYLELLLVIAMATFFSTFATPLMSVIFTLGLWICGHMGPALQKLGEMSESPAVKQLFNAIYLVLPNLAALTEVRFELTTPPPPGMNLPVYHFSPELVLTLVSYVLAYVVVLLSLGTVIIERREFN